MKVSEIAARATREAIMFALQVHGVDPDDPMVFVEADEIERRRLLVATSVGVLDANHALIPGHPVQSWALDVKVIPWHAITDLTVASRTIRNDWEGWDLALTVSAPSLGLEATGSYGPEADRDRGLAAFAARCLEALAARSV